ncbi:MAG: trypsin-like peptidase domain-containing protein [Phycisphaerales bacterium]|nr:trypsin-like peptidase domain-containing protein [Phycisphaerales bacterium]
MRRFVSYGPSVVVLLTSMAALIVVPELVRRVEDSRTQATVRLAHQALGDDDILERLNRATRAVSTSVEPGVVHLVVEGGPARDLDQANGADGNGQDNDPGDNQRQNPRGRGWYFRGSTGSGWVFDDKGHIITNAHVVRGARNISVQFSSGRVASATLVGADPFTDIAVLQVDVKRGLFPLRRASGERPEQGDRVFAFGSPFGFKFSMSEGIISGLGRSARPVLEMGGFTNFIQTDAAVNPGNSGGPLVDIRGHVIGMNVAIATGRESDGTSGEAGQSAGISFAIPLDTIESVVEQIISNGRVARGFLGIQFDRGVAEIINDGEFVGLGLRISSVVSGGAAENSGLRRDDIIRSVAGYDTSDPEVLRAVVSACRPGQVVPAKVWRDSEEIDMNITLGERDVASLVNDAWGYIARQLGMAVRANAGDATIGFVVPGSVAARAGLKAGQIITRIADRNVNDEVTAYAAFIDAGLLIGKQVELRIKDSAADESDRAINVRLFE